MGSLVYDDTGQGYPLIFLHGFCETRELWAELTEQLSPHYRVLSPDLPGFGESRHLTWPFGMTDVADTIKNWLDELGISKCVIMGHSMGGYITLAFAEKYPDMLAGYGLIHSSALSDDKEKKIQRGQVIEFVEKHGVFKFVTSFVPALFTIEFRDQHPNIVADLVGLSATTSKDTLIQYTEIIRDRKNQLKLLHQKNMEVFFLAGTLDTSVPYDKSLLQTDGQTHINFKTLDTGHLGFYERPEESAQTIINYMNRIPLT